MDWAAGLLGGVMGAGTAIDQIGTEKRKELAEHLKMQALEKIEERADIRRHGQAKELQGEKMEHETGLQEKDIGSREKIAGEGITSAEKIASERNQMYRDLAKERNRLDEKLRQTQENTEENKRLKIKSDTVTKAMKYLQEGGDLEGAQAMLDAAEVDYSLETYVKTPATEGGIFGWGAEPEVTAERIKIGKPSATETKPGESEPTDLKSDLARLVAKGKEPMPPATEAKPEKVETDKAGMIGDAAVPREEKVLPPKTEEAEGLPLIKPPARPLYGAEEEGGTIGGEIGGAVAGAAKGTAEYLKKRQAEAKKAEEEYRKEVERDIKEAKKLGLTLQQYRELKKKNRNK